MTNRLIIGSGYTSRALYKSWNIQSNKSTYLTTTTPSNQSIIIKQGYQCLLMRPGKIFDIKEQMKTCTVLVIAITPKDKKEAIESQEYLSHQISHYYNSLSELPQKHIILLSSSGVYGDHNGSWVSETNECLTNDTVCHSLLSAEKTYLSLLSSTKTVTILRLGGIYGPKKTHKQRFSTFIHSKRCLLPSAYCNYVHQEDIVRAINWVLEKKLNGIYNICSDDHPTKEMLIKHVFNNQPEFDNNLLSMPSLSKRGNKRVSNKKIKNTGFVFKHHCISPKK